MENLWISAEKSPLATWRANLTVIKSKPEKLFQWLISVLEMGEMFQVLRVEEARDLDYLRSRDGLFPAFVEKVFHEKGILDLFRFVGQHSILDPKPFFRYSGHVCYFDAHGNLAERDIEDLYELLLELRPEVAKSVRYLGWAPGPCIWIEGPRIDLKNPSNSAVPGTGYLFIDVQLYSDIWFPWVDGPYARGGVEWPERSARRREEFRRQNPAIPSAGIGFVGMSRNFLAQHHTPRLNQFLSGVHHLTKELGGNWERLGIDYTRPDYLRMTDEDGIFLDAPIPPNFVDETDL
jgi:hypothetical protein